MLHNPSASSAGNVLIFNTKVLIQPTVWLVHNPPYWAQVPLLPYAAAYTHRLPQGLFPVATGYHEVQLTIVCFVDLMSVLDKLSGVKPDWALSSYVRSVRQGQMGLEQQRMLKPSHSAALQVHDSRLWLIQHWITANPSVTSYTYVYIYHWW